MRLHLEGSWSGCTSLQHDSDPLGVEDWEKLVELAKKGVEYWLNILTC